MIDSVDCQIARVQHVLRWENAEAMRQTLIEDFFYKKDKNVFLSFPQLSYPR